MNSVDIRESRDYSFLKGRIKKNANYDDLHLEYALYKKIVL